MIPILPRPTKEEAEVFLVFKSDKKWETLEDYLKRCFDTVIAILGNPESPRDEDQVLKGMKLAIEHMAKLPAISQTILNPQKEEEPDEV